MYPVVTDAPAVSARSSALLGSTDSSLATWLVPTIVGVAVVVVLVVGWFTVHAARRARSFARSTEVVPGTPSVVPSAWATSPAPAAVIHRRMRYAVALLHSSSALARHEQAGRALAALDQAVVDLDRRLAVADDLTLFDNAATALERLPTRLALATVGEAAPTIAEVADYLRDPVIPPETGESAYPPDEYDA